MAGAKILAVDAGEVNGTKRYRLSASVRRDGHFCVIGVHYTHMGPFQENRSQLPTLAPGARLVNLSK